MNQDHENGRNNGGAHRGNHRSERPFKKDGEFRKENREDRPYRKDERKFDRPERPFKKDGEFRKENREDRPYRKDERKFDRPERPFKKDGEFRKENREDRPYRKDERKFDRPERPFKKDGEFRKENREDRPYRKDERKFDRPERPFKKDGEFRKENCEDRPYRKDERKFDRPERPFKKDGEFRKDRAPSGFDRWEKRPMPQQSARDVALKALSEVVGKGAFASQALDRALNGAKLSDDDRRLAASLFYFAIENRLHIEWALGKLMENRPEPMIADILHIAAAQILFMDKIPDHAAVDEAVKQVKNTHRDGLTGLVNGVLRSLIRMRDEGELVLPDRETQQAEYLSVKYSLAESAVKRLIAGYGLDMAEQIAAYVPNERTQTIRPNLLRTDVAAFEAMLDREGFRWKHGAVENAYVLSGAGDLSAHKGYQEGMFSIQGESSMLAAQAVCAKPGMQILDACAAPGGKTCLMAEQMGTSGRVYAWDVYPHRVELIRAAANRLGLENVRPAVHDSKKTMEALELGMDAVLVDAPCSGLGVIADKPDIKYRVTDKDFESLLPIQAQILENCAGFVKVGGTLVYSTCTILPEENELQVNAFLEKHPEFERVTDEKWLPEALRGRMVDGMLTILPSRDSLEGFFIARMRRRSV